MTKEEFIIEFDKTVAQQCSVVHPNAIGLTPEEFTNLRRVGLGASDASVILGAMPDWKTTEDVIKEKVTKDITADELEVGRKPAVRKGRDLEPLVLSKASELLNSFVYKPTAMYRIRDYAYLTVNYDGVVYDKAFVPVEAKVVTIYGAKYYDTTKAIAYLNYEKKILKEKETFSSSFFNQNLETKAAACGIPNYYYVQVQQQMLGLNADHGYLAALNDKDWTLYLYYVPKDPIVQTQIILKGHHTSERIARLLKHSDRPWLA